MGLPSEDFEPRRGPIVHLILSKLSFLVLMARLRRPGPHALLRRRLVAVGSSSWNPANDEQICSYVKSCFKVLDSNWGTANDEQILHRCQELFQGP